MIFKKSVDDGHLGHFICHFYNMKSRPREERLHVHKNSWRSWQELRKQLRVIQGRCAWSAMRGLRHILNHYKSGKNCLRMGQLILVTKNGRNSIDREGRRRVHAKHSVGYAHGKPGHLLKLLLRHRGLRIPATLPGINTLSFFPLFSSKS